MSIMLLGYIWLLFLGAAASPALARMAWVPRTLPGMRPLAVFALAAGGWCVASLLFATSAISPLTPIWFRLQYLVSSSLTLPVAVFAYQIGRAHV